MIKSIKHYVNDWGHVMLELTIITHDTKLGDYFLIKHHNNPKIQGYFEVISLEKEFKEDYYNSSIEVRMREIQSSGLKDLNLEISSFNRSFKVKHIVDENHIRVIKNIYNPPTA